MFHNKFVVCLLFVLCISSLLNARHLQQSSDLNEWDVSERDISERDVSERDADPGWIRRQLMRAGEAASSVGNKMGGFALKLTNAVDRICGIIKKVIPIVGAVCTVGQFQFCALDNVTGGDFPVSSNIAGPGTANIVDLDVQD